VGKPGRNDVAIARLQRVLSVSHVVELHPAFEDVNEEEVELGVLVLPDRGLRPRHTLDDVGVVGAARRLVDAELAIDEHRTGRAVIRLDGFEVRILDVGDEQRLFEFGLRHGFLRAGYVALYYPNVQ
jgi:hypothetical protein